MDYIYGFVMEPSLHVQLRCYRKARATDCFGGASFKTSRGHLIRVCTFAMLIYDIHSHLLSHVNITFTCLYEIYSTLSKYIQRARRCSTYLDSKEPKETKGISSRITDCREVQASPGISRRETKGKTEEWWGLQDDNNYCNTVLNVSQERP